MTFVKQDEEWNTFLRTYSSLNIGYDDEPVYNEQQNFNEYNLSPRCDVKHGSPEETEMDYSVTFKTPELGFSIVSTHKDKNALVDRLESHHSLENIFEGSLICSINGQWVIGTKTTAIEMKILRALNYPPTRIRFRAKRWMMDSLCSGTLMIQIIAAEELYYKATHGSIRVDDLQACTSKVSSGYNLIFDDVLKWKHFKPHLASRAVLKMWKYRRFLRSSCVGKCEVPIPKAFDRVMNHVLDLKDNYNNIVGLVQVRCIVGRKSNKANVRNTFVNQSKSVHLTRPRRNHISYV